MARTPSPVVQKPPRPRVLAQRKNPITAAGTSKVVGINMADYRTTIFERPKVENVSTSIPRKRKINSIILGKNRKGREARQDTPTPPQSPAPKRAKPVAKSPTKSPPKGEDERPAAPKKPEERIFHLSGPKNYLLRDGPVTLNPFQNRHAPGGFAVRIMQKGEYVGLIGLGQESLCRKLLVHFKWNPLISRLMDGTRSCDT